MRSADFAYVAKRIVSKNVQCRLQVLCGDRLADLWRVHDRRVEDDLIGKQVIQLSGLLGPDQLVPVLQRIDVHLHFHFVQAG